MHNYFSIRKIFTSTFLLSLTIFCKAQGGWNIGYVKVDSISKNHLGLRVRIDFRSSGTWKSSGRKRHIRSYVGTKDTGTVRIDQNLLILAERRKIYADNGIYNDQYLECINCKKESLFIYDAKIVGVDKHSIQFQFDIKMTKADGTLKGEQKNIRIDRNKLDGVMYEL